MRLYYLENINLDNTTSIVSCRMFDNLNTPSDYFNFTLVTDYTDPVPILTYNSNGMFVFSDSIITPQCADNSSISSVYLGGYRE